MNRAVKIRSLAPPSEDLSTFDPGEYLAHLDFYETDAPITDEERHGLAQFAHFLAYIALRARSSRWGDSVVPTGTPAYRALESHFSHISGWESISNSVHGMSYRHLVSFLMGPFPPQRSRAHTGADD
jgi:hypothetical protein